MYHPWKLTGCVVLILVLSSYSYADEHGCKGDLNWNNCAASCVLRCNQTMIPCPRNCAQRCACHYSTPYQVGDDKCVTLEGCEDECTGGEVWITDGSLCTPTCDDVDNLNVCAGKRGGSMPRCACPESAPYRHEDSCLTKEQCENRKRASAFLEDLNDEFVHMLEEKKNIDDYKLKYQ